MGLAPKTNKSQVIVSYASIEIQSGKMEFNLFLGLIPLPASAGLMMVMHLKNQGARSQNPKE